MSFHENLRYYRKKAGYSTQKMANLLGITANTYAGYEIREREPKYKTLCMIANILNVSADDLLGITTNIIGNKDNEKDRSKRAERQHV